AGISRIRRLERLFDLRQAVERFRRDWGGDWGDERFDAAIRLRGNTPLGRNGKGGCRAQTSQISIPRLTSHRPSYYVARPCPASCSHWSGATVRQSASTRAAFLGRTG